MDTSDLDLRAHPLVRREREQFAWGIARGISPSEAARAAGYANPGRGASLARAKDIAARARFVKRHLERGGSADLSAIIEALMDLADEGRRLGAAAGLAAAKGALVEAARLKQLLPVAAPETRAELDLAREAELTDEEWLAKYGPVPPIKADER
ncbi:MAG: hypothetical protein ACRED9_11965 [Caulobacteraceae bacterium]